MDNPPDVHQDVAPSEKPKGILYHYTDQKGMLGILESRSIWATHVRYLNDSSEFTLGWTKSWEKLQNLIEQSDFLHKDQLKRIFTRFRRAISDAPGHTNYYLWCLTDDEATADRHHGFNGDRLSQWRAYAGSGVGFSLGFDASLLDHCFSTPLNVVFNLRRCLYDEEQQDEKIEQIAANHLGDFLEKWSTYFQKLRNPNLSPAENLKNNGEFLFGPIVNMYADFIEFGSFIKHPGFREENEWRFAFISEKDGDCSFRESRFGLTPYLPIGLDLGRFPSPLKRIVVGPGPHKGEWVKAIRLLLAKSAIPGVEVVASEIPYR